MSTGVVRFADLTDASDAAAVVEILDSYASGPFGQNQPLAAAVRQDLVTGLRTLPTSTVLFACVDQRPVGIAVCFQSYSTFAAKPLINIHDLAVLPEYRGRGLGRMLLDAVADMARERGCCKVTLEVRENNDPARKLYTQAGFGPWDQVTLFVTKRL